jgi:hypothetical protein
LEKIVIDGEYFIKKSPDTVKGNANMYLSVEMNHGIGVVKMGVDTLNRSTESKIHFIGGKGTTKAGYKTKIFLSRIIPPWLSLSATPI